MPPSRAARAASTRWKRSNTRSASSGGMPGPSSATSMVVTPSVAAWALSHTRPSAGEWRTAFSSRLAITWCIRSESPTARRSPGWTSTRSHTGRAVNASPSSHSRVACSSSVRTGNGAGPQRQRAALQPRQVEQLLDEPAEPLGLAQRRAQRGGIGRLDAVDEVLQQRLQRADRRAQLVRDVGDEVAAHAVDVGQLGGHRVERAGQLADLVARGRAHAPAVVAARHRGRRGRHLAQRRGHPARQELHDRRAR